MNKKITILTLMVILTTALSFSVFAAAPNPGHLCTEVATGIGDKCDSIYSSGLISADTGLSTGGTIISDGDLTVGGNNIKSSGGTVAITLSGADVTTAGGLTIGGSFTMATGAAAGYVLTSDADGVGTWEETSSATGTIDGSGTANYIPKFTAATTLGDSVISESAGNIDIAGDLTVSGNDIKSSTGTPITLSGNNVDIAGTLDFTGTVRRIRFSGGAKTIQDGGTAGYLVIWDGSNSAMEICTETGTGCDAIGDVTIHGGLYVDGSFAARYKNFDIVDPRYNNPDIRLIHSSIEGPEHAVYYRGEERLVGGRAVVKLPDYFEALTRKEGRTVILTPKNGWSPLYVEGEIENGKFIVKTTQDGKQNQEFFWVVYALRDDIPLLEPEVIN